MLLLSAHLALFLAALFFLQKRLARYLQILQQEDYDNRRLLHWLWQSKSGDQRASLATAIAFVITSASSQLLAIFFLALALAFIAKKEPNPSKTGKIRLHRTQRALRIEKAAFVLFTLLYSLLAALYHPILFFPFLIICWQAIPFILIAANSLTYPIERKNQARFLKEAERLITTYQPLIIGITGSFGKTTTKATLGHVLKLTLGPTFWPAKSINTLMGVTRAIRQELRAAHRFALFEMGAYRIGSIAKLAALTPPKAAIITAVDVMHLERFGSEENVFKAKSELAQALPDDGILVCNGDGEKTRLISQLYPKKTTLLYGFDNCQPLDCHIAHYQMKPEGTTFTFNLQGTLYQGHTPLLGKGALASCAAAFTLAYALGANLQLVLHALATLPPVDNRLHVVAENQGWTLHDAYNSNPQGFRAALEVLQDLPAKRRLLMTPGMIELGEKQAAENCKIAREAAKICDLIFFVGQENQAAFLQGLEEAGFAKTQLILAPTREEAFASIQRLRAPGDALLIENDLPDVYEKPCPF